METNLIKNGLNSINSGLQMLNESRTENLAALAQISITLNFEKVREHYPLDENVNELLSTMHFILSGINNDSIKLVSDFINNKLYDNQSAPLNCDFKEKYEQLLEKHNQLQTELLSLKESANA